MPVSIVDTDGGRGNRITVTGDDNFASVMHAFEVHLTQPTEKFNRYLYSLINLSEISRMPITTDLIRNIGALCSAAGERNESPSFDAVVVTKPWLYGFIRMWEAYARNSGWEIRIFKTTNEAIDWLKQRVYEQYQINDLTFE